MVHQVVLMDHRTVHRHRCTGEPWGIHASLRCNCHHRALVVGVLLQRRQGARLHKDHVVRLAILAERLDVVFLGIGDQVHDHRVLRHERRGDGARRRGLQRGAIPHQRTLGTGCHHVSRKRQGGEWRAHPWRAIIVEGIADAGHGQDGQLVRAACQPIGQLVTAMLTEVDDRLLVGHLALVLHAVRDQVDMQRLCVALHGFFVAFALTVTNHTITHQVSDQLHDDFRALLGGGQIGDALHHAVVAGAHEVLHEHRVARGCPDFTRPGGFFLGGQGGKIGFTHDMLLKMLGYVSGHAPPNARNMATRRPRAPGRLTSGRRTESP